MRQDALADFVLAYGEARRGAAGVLEDGTSGSERGLHGGQLVERTVRGQGKSVGVGGGDDLGRVSRPGFRAGQDNCYPGMLVLTILDLPHVL